MSQHLIAKRCTYGNRGRMLALKERVFERYNFYTQNKNNLNAIRPVNVIGEDEKKLLENSYQNSSIFKKVKQQCLKTFRQEEQECARFA